MHNACSDEELLYMVRMQDEIAIELLLERMNLLLYKTIELIVKRLGCYEMDDAKQAVRLGCLSAVDTFRVDKDSSFRYFAKMCAEREVRTLFRKERNKGMSSHYRSVSLDQVREDEGIYYVDMVENTHQEFNPSWCVDYQQLQMSLDAYIETLKPLERIVCQLRVEGYSYREIAQKLQLSIKTVDNTVQRIRKRRQRLFD